MSALREAVCLEMRLRGYSPRTHASYLYALEQLWAFYRRNLARLTCAEVQRFLDEIITVRKLAWATVNVYFSNGHDLFAIKRCLGHSALATTGRYLHVVPGAPAAVSPLDALDERA